MCKRKVVRVVTGIRTEDGDGVKLTRVIGHGDVKDFDPFLMLDAFDSRNPADYIAGFPWHPHRGIETVTYLIAGKIEHQDSLGNKGCISDGSCQWMTAGGGILHQEMPQSSEHMLGAQLWINLPKKDKMVAPAYNDIRPESILNITEGGAKVRIIAGEYSGRKAPMQGEYVKATYLDVELEPKRSWNVETPADHTVFLYAVSGSLEIDDAGYPAGRAILFTPGNTVSLASGETGARFLFFSAMPLKEPVAWGGPIVMNTEEELELAFRELDEGTFLKPAMKTAMRIK